MAKKSKINASEFMASPQVRIKRTEAYAEKVRLMFAQTVNNILALNKSMPSLDDGVMFSFDGGSSIRLQHWQSGGVLPLNGISPIMRSISS